jgi:hypothetical protein
MVLLNRNARSVWVDALQAVPGLPPCPEDLSEPAYTRLAFDTHCSVRPLKPVYDSWSYELFSSAVVWALRVLSGYGGCARAASVWMTPCEFAPPEQRVCTLTLDAAETPTTLMKTRPARCSLHGSLMTIYKLSFTPFASASTSKVRNDATCLTPF